MGGVPLPVVLGKVIVTSLLERRIETAISNTPAMLHPWGPGGDMRRVSARLQGAAGLCVGV